MKNLINCSDCGREVSKNANSCPNCGKSMKTNAVNILAGVILLIGFLFVVGYAVSSIKFSASSEPPKFSLRGEVFINDNGQKYPFETASVRIYETDKIKDMSADEIETTAPDAITATDADGKFSVKVPDGNYTVFANASRAVNKQIENYHWKKQLTISGSETEIILNNSNLDTAEK